MPGTITSVPEVTHVSKHGLWLLLRNEEHLLPFKKFLWFKQAMIEDVEWPTPDHLYWPKLDVDLSAESIRNPESFPLVAKSEV